MKKITALITIVFVVSAIFFALGKIIPFSMTGAPPYDVANEPPDDLNPYAWLNDWIRPDGPARVGLQVGHWKNEELPVELERLIGNTGASGGGKSEWEVNMAIAEAAAEMLQNRGVVVDILPATIPQDYWADVFVAIHADGNLDRTVSGFKAAAPRRDFTGQANQLVEQIVNSYKAATGLSQDPNVSRNMRGYYAFAWWRYDHAVHPMTRAAILETGFLSNASDRRIIVDKPEISAKGLADGIIKYLESTNLLTATSSSQAAD